MEKDDVESLVKTTLGEIEKVLGSKTVVGEPIIVGDSTIIPLISVGFGFGGGAGTGKGEAKEKGEGAGSAGAGGGGAKPIAVIIVDKDGARIEPIKGGMATALEKIGETMPEMMVKFAEKWGDRKKDQKKEG
ncbi:unnamed protein product [marine sediment metagenome]|uniref:Sporulation protein YtfJ n=1 Tax=marine sediment metagenome TaxID=412755 RepID=X1VDQ6_9ZZZZ